MSKVRQRRPSPNCRFGLLWRGAGVPCPPGAPAGLAAGRHVAVASDKSHAAFRVVLTSACLTLSVPQCPLSPPSLYLAFPFPRLPLRPSWAPHLVWFIRRTRRLTSGRPTGV